jgi:Lysophospholipase L1 and related esterases
MNQIIPTSANGCIPNVYFMGRWTTQTVETKPAMYTTNLGAQILFEVQNADYFTLEVVIKPLAAPQTLSVYIDNELHLTPLTQSKNDFKLSSNQSHIVRIYFTGNTDQDEVWLGNDGLTIKDITIDSGTLTAIKPAGPLVAFIGDSITAGCWVRSKAPSIGYGADLNYAAQLSRALDWEDYRIAYSAAGIIRYGTGGVPPAGKFVKYVNFSVKAPQINPDLVLINLGTNDARYEDDVFEMYFVWFINKVKKQFPHARIIIITPFNQAHAHVIKNVAKALKIELIPTLDWVIETNDEVHPNVEGSKAISDHLVAWFTEPQNRLQSE